MKAKKCASCGAPRKSGGYCQDCAAAYQRARRWKPVLVCSKCKCERPNKDELDDRAKLFLPMIEFKRARKLAP